MVRDGYIHFGIALKRGSLEFGFILGGIEDEVYAMTIVWIVDPAKLNVKQIDGIFLVQPTGELDQQGTLFGIPQQKLLCLFI